MSDDTVGPPYRVAYTVTVDTLMDASRSMTAGATRWVTAGAAVVVAAGLFTALLGQPVLGIGLVGVGIFLFVAYSGGFINRSVIRRRARSILGMTAELVIDAGGIETANPHESSHLSWSAVTDVREDRRTVVFMRDRLLVAYAPAAAFGSPARRREIVAFARAQITSPRAHPVT